MVPSGDHAGDRSSAELVVSCVSIAVAGTQSTSEIAKTIANRIMVLSSRISSVKAMRLPV
jgi:hypothetical protein